MMRHTFCVGFLIAVIGCDQSPPEPVRTPPAPPAVKPEPKRELETALPAPPRAVGAEKARLPAVERLVAIGDLHGDLGATREVFRLAGAVDVGDAWVGGSLVVVQTGDQIDRGDDDREVLEWLEALVAKAADAGGALHLLNGNHETMNAAGDFRYVTEKSFVSFEGTDSRTLPQVALQRLPEAARARAAAFLPGGSFANVLARRPMILIVGDSVFVHGGVLPSHVDYGIDRINDEVSAWLLGKGPAPRIIDGDDSPVWTRLYSEPAPEPGACRTLERVLERLVVRRMVVGHTVQRAGITAACDDQVHRIDVGLSRHYGGSVVQALEIAKGKTRVLSAPRAGALPAAAE